MEEYQSRSNVLIEVWSSLATGRNEVAASFSSGWISSLRVVPFGAAVYPGRELTLDHTEVLELVSRRFAGRGPVRLFLVDDFFNLDQRELGSYDGLRYNETSIEPFWPLIGGLGLGR